MLPIRGDYTPPRYLTEYGQEHRPWDVHRAHVQDLEALLGTAATPWLRSLAARLHDCSSRLGFGWKTDADTGERQLRLGTAHFCRVRNCPICQWRRSMLWRARFIQALPAILDEYPRARWVFLTLTVRNCPLTELRATITSMNAAWHRLLKRPEFRTVLGWVRTTEVTVGADGSAHPHFHCLLMVRPSYFTGKRYVPQARWAEVWRECARLDYTPIVDVRAVKPKAGTEETPQEAIVSAAVEVLKYATKAEDLISAGPEWVHEYMAQVHRLRFVATGGALKNALKVGQETAADLVRGDEDGEDDETDAAPEPEVFFDWQRRVRRYERR